MAKLTARIGFIEFGLGLAVFLVLGRAVQLQLVQGAKWEEKAERLRMKESVTPARRGRILDRRGKSLAVTIEYYHVGINPDRMENARATATAVGAALGIRPKDIERRLRAKGGKYTYLPGRYRATQVQAIRHRPELDITSELARFYPAGNLARPVIGTLAPDSLTGASGLERALDEYLRGIPGRQVRLRDYAGRLYESPSRIVREPVPGNDILLTIDAGLQDIAERGLEEALEAMHADGGDVVFLDPNTGEILALASRKASNGRWVAKPTGLTDPFEPGSTAKIFTAAALLRNGLVSPADSVFVERGEWDQPLPNGRTRQIKDAHAGTGWYTLAHAIEVSSNVATAKFAQRIPPTAHYDLLRDFGFGTPTGVEFPSESPGRLNRPDRWNPYYSQSSIAMGYEFQVTPLQLAAAYAAIANDGILLTPTLIHSVIGPDGKELYRHQPEPVRRVVSPEVAQTLRDYLRGAAGEGGTGEQAQLVNYTLIGKTGTARRLENGRYVSEYTASFAALFPEKNPQLAVIVKIDNPQGSYYGGLTAAPLTRRMLEQALSSRRSAINRGRLAEAEEGTPAPSARVQPAEDVEDAADVVVRWPYHPSGDTSQARVPVPELVGLDVRAAVQAVHQRGMNARLIGTGRVVRSDPAVGDSVAAGTLVTLWGERAAP